MNRVILLERLRDFSREATADLIMPTKMQDGDSEQKYRAASVYLMRLPDSRSATKKAPYILHQFLTGEDIQQPGKRATSAAIVRTIFCVYSDDEQEGGMMLLNLMERLRIALLRQGVIGNQFALDLSNKLEALAYPDDTAPYYAGEMISTWILPAVERGVVL